MTDEEALASIPNARSDQSKYYIVKINGCQFVEGPFKTKEEVFEQFRWYHYDLYAVGLWDQGWQAFSTK